MNGRRRLRGLFVVIYLGKAFQKPLANVYIAIGGQLLTYPGGEGIGRYVVMVVSIRVFNRLIRDNDLVTQDLFDDLEQLPERHGVVAGYDQVAVLEFLSEYPDTQLGRIPDVDVFP